MDNEMIRMTMQPNLRQILSHEFLTSDEVYNTPIASPVASPGRRQRKNIISNMLKTSFHSKSAEDHTANTEGSSSSNSDQIQSLSSPRKLRKSRDCQKHSSPTRTRNGIRKILNERSISPLKVPKSKQYASCAGNESMSTLVSALNEISQSLDSQMEGSDFSKKVTSSTSLCDNHNLLLAYKSKPFDTDIITGDSACSSFKPHGHYMINHADTNTLWVSSGTSHRPHLELNITRHDSPPDLMVRRGTCKRKSLSRSRSLRFVLSGVTKKEDNSAPRQKHVECRRNSMK